MRLFARRNKTILLRLLKLYCLIFELHKVHNIYRLLYYDTFQLEILINTCYLLKTSNCEKCSNVLFGLNFIDMNCYTKEGICCQISLLFSMRML